VLIRTGSSDINNRKNTRSFRPTRALVTARSLHGRRDDEFENDYADTKIAVTPWRACRPCVSSRAARRVLKSIYLLLIRVYFFSCW